MARSERAGVPADVARLGTQFAQEVRELARAEEVEPVVVLRQLLGQVARDLHGSCGCAGCRGHRNAARSP